MEPRSLVCIMGEVFSKLLLLSAPFPSKNGQRPPSSLRTDHFFGVERRFVGVWGWFVNTRLALIRLRLCSICLTPLLGAVGPQERFQGSFLGGW